MNAPSMAGWNLALRFVLELAAIAGLATAAWKLAPGATRWVAVFAVPAVAVVVWGVFNVVGDPSRSGEAPIEVTGWTRLAVEVLILGGGAIAFAIVGRGEIAVGFAVLVVIQYATSWSRVEWLVQA